MFQLNLKSELWSGSQAKRHSTVGRKRAWGRARQKKESKATFADRAKKNPQKEQRVAQAREREGNKVTASEGEAEGQTFLALAINSARGNKESRRS